MPNEWYSLSTSRNLSTCSFFITPSFFCSTLPTWCKYRCYCLQTKTYFIQLIALFAFKTCKYNKFSASSICIISNNQQLAIPNSFEKPLTLYLHQSKSLSLLPFYIFRNAIEGNDFKICFDIPSTS